MLKVFASLLPPPRESTKQTSARDSPQPIDLEVEKSIVSFETKLIYFSNYLSHP